MPIIRTAELARRWAAGVALTCLLAVLPLAAAGQDGEAMDPAALGIRSPQERLAEPDDRRTPLGWRRRVEDDWRGDGQRRSGQTLGPQEFADDLLPPPDGGLRTGR